MPTPSPALISLWWAPPLAVFLAELGDKTQLATVAISGTSNAPVVVFAASASALVLASLIGALPGLAGASGARRVVATAGSGGIPRDWRSLALGGVGQ